MRDTGSGALRHRRPPHWPVVLIGLLGISLLLTASPSPAAAGPAADWNATALNALFAAGHNPVTVTRGLAMVQAAVHDALNAVERRYDGYLYEGAAEAHASPEAAVATAARDVLVLAIPAFGTAAQQAAALATVDAAYTSALAKLPDGEGKTRGLAVGRAAAAAIVSLRVVTMTPSPPLVRLSSTPRFPELSLPFCPSSAPAAAARRRFPSSSA